MTTKTNSKSTKKSTTAKPRTAKTSKGKVSPELRTYRKEKKSKVKSRSRTPITLAEQNERREKRSPINFIRSHNEWQFVLFFALCALSGVFIFASVKSDETLPFVIWCNNASHYLFGTTGILFFGLLFVFSFRFLLSYIDKLKKIHYRVYNFLLGVFVYVQLLLQHNANKMIPPTAPDKAGGTIADFIDRLLTNILGSGGFIILMIILGAFLIIRVWNFINEKQNENDGGVPVKVYWDNVFTARDLEKIPEESLQTDMADDFRFTPAKTEQSEPKATVHQARMKIANPFRELRAALEDVARPVQTEADKAIILEKEKARSAVKRQQSAEIEPPETEEQTFERDLDTVRTVEVPRKARKDTARLIQNISEQAQPEPEDKPTIPVNEIIPTKEEIEPEVHFRSHSVTLDENEEKVNLQQKETFAFVPVMKKPSVVPSNTDDSGDRWELPSPDDFLDPYKVHHGVTPEDPEILEQAEKIETMLRKFGAPGNVVEIKCGPTFSQFGVEPGFISRGAGKKQTRVRIRQIEALSQDLKMELALEKITIEAPIPGKTYVGIQMPNKVRVPVTLREIIEDPSFAPKKSELAIALGKDINGAAISADLTRMPHLLIAGTTGSGKSVCLNAILTCLLMNNSPDHLKLVLVDPKRVELSGYNGIPHLITPVVTDVEQVSNVLQGVLNEMDKRNLFFMENGVRNIQDYNRNFPDKKLPYIVVVIDELANLMLEAASEVEGHIVRLAQTARAMGIHLIVATQRPSHDVITGTIKGNLPTRIAFAVSSHVDSQVILDRTGAETLFGKGDMLFLSAEDIALKRLQCVFVSDDEIHRIVNYWKTAIPKDSTEKDGVYQPVTEKAARIPEIRNGMLTKISLESYDAPPMKSDADMVYEEAVKLVQRSGRVSAHMLVSKLSIGYGRANKFICRMEDEGIIGPPSENSNVPREVLDFGEYGPEFDGEQD